MKDERPKGMNQSSFYLFFRTIDNKNNNIRRKNTGRIIFVAK